MNRLGLLLLLLGAFTSIAAAASAPTFCKCTCFTNSTIIEIKSKSSSLGNSHLKEPDDPHTSRASLSPSCSQCNRAFCLSQSLPICKGAAEKDVVTMCFQRDSRKDMIIVWAFILGTAGLLGWAALRKVMDMHDRTGGIAASIAGGLTRGSGGGGGGTGLGIGGNILGSTGSDGGRGRYVGLSENSREGSAVFG
ncbi:hypothetical protein M406DRAFT_267001 [Cryphonectria parasitica EP155]|uniref:Uncharacterized protein n=1 Tax=Cryphonectria parasitica (strain ATCC 38755 / EP155) TaxID=660469 RepID=A0A9P4XW47_CRYP1|nr:uncharacterized protein M406DRAFT_267001 [Cryphonectria parasitica EP155]KAF3761655.1 hypothetical protein M406DRAFT_267001 [Cryphonectria parasitica EP155]